MSASFPNAKKTFSQLVDGTTYVEATNVNTSYDEVEAIETFIGAMGCTSQSYTESLKNLLRGYVKNCYPYYKTAADLYVAAGEVSCVDASGNVRFRRNTDVTTVAWTEIDGGSEAASTRYYVYARADAAATTFTVLLSSNSTAPAGATFYKSLGSFYNDSGSNINSTSLAIGDLPTIRTLAYTGTTANQTILHGLKTTPTFAVFQSIADGARRTLLWTPGMASNKACDVTAGGTATIFTGAPDATSFYLVGNYADCNANGEGYVLIAGCI
jgi:hypothetical protein